MLKLFMVTDMEKPKNKKFFRNKVEMVVTCTIFILCIIGFIYFGRMDFHKEVLSDSALMNKNHPEVDVDNVYEFVNATQVNTYISRKKVIILFGTNNKWTGYYAKILNEVALAVGIDKIYYYDIEDDRAKNNATFENIVYFLDNYVVHLDNGKGTIYGPTLLVINDGVVSLFDDETALIHGSTTPEEYWNDYNTNLKINTLTNILLDYKG